LQGTHRLGSLSGGNIRPCQRLADKQEVKSLLIGMQGRCKRFFVFTQSKLGVSQVISGGSG
jgi:hypothetical protein